MKITLISTLTYPSDQGIRTISSVLKEQGYDVKIVFMVLSEDYSLFYSKDELAQLLKLCKGSDFIGINCFASTAKRAVQIIRFLKKSLNVPIVWGGVHATISPNTCIKDADFVCVGECEEAIVELADAIKQKKDPSAIKNVWVKKDGKVVRNVVRHLVHDVDKIPFPDYDIEDHFLLDDGKIRLFEDVDLGGQIFFLTGRGCPYGCDYCSNNFFNELYEGKRKQILRWHSVEYIIKGILLLKKKFPSLGYFDIRDDTFSLRPLDQIKDFCEQYKRKVGMRFKCLGDPKTISDEKIKLLVDAGCTDIIIGIQGSERTNKEIYHRMQTDANVVNAARILGNYRNRLNVMYDVISCNPYEEPKDIINLIRLLQKVHKPYFLSVNNLVFFTGSKLYEKAKIDGVIKREIDSGASLNYWDRAKHIRLKKKNVYLNLILNLMRGKVTKRRYGIMPNFLLNFLLDEKRVERNLRDPSFSRFILLFVSAADFSREEVIKPMFRALPLFVRVWYDKVRYG